MSPTNCARGRACAAALGLLACLAYASPAAGQQEVHVNEPFEARLEQKNRDKPVFVVTSDGKTFTEARLIKGHNTPLSVHYSVQCRDGYTDPFSNTVHSDGQIKYVRLETGAWAAELPSLSDDWSTFYDLFFDTLDRESIEADFNLVSQGPDAAHVRSVLNDVKPKAIAACNDALEAMMRRGFTRQSALTRIGTINPLPNVAPEILPAVMYARCDHDAFTVTEEDESKAVHRETSEQVKLPPLNLSLPVRCESPFETPETATDDLAQSFGVQEIELAPDRDPYTGECPLTVHFSGHVRLTGSGQLRYRYRTGSGALGAPVTVQVKDGRTPVPLSLDIEVGRKPSGPGLTTPQPGGKSGPTLTVPLPTPDPKGPTLRGAGTPSPPGRGPSGIATPEAPGQVSDWVRLEVLSPTQGVRASEEVFYKAICEQNPVAGGGRVTPPRPPGGPGVPQPPPSRTTPGGTPAPGSAPSRTTPADTPSGRRPGDSPSRTTPGDAPSRTTPGGTPSRTNPGRERQPETSARPGGSRSTPRAPDLVLRSVGGRRAGGCRFVVANVGDERAGRSRLRLRARGRPSVEVAVPPIAPGDQRVVDATLDPAVVWMGSLDPENTVREAREDNNTFSIRGCQLAGLR